MTREEAIKRLKMVEIREALQEDYDAIDMAISALSAEPKCPYTDEMCKMCKECDIDKAEREWAERREP